MDSATLMLAPAVVYLLGIAAALIGPRDRATAAYLVALLGSVAGLAVAGQSLLNGSTFEWQLATVTPFAHLAFRLDPLAAFFLLVISLLAVPTSLYAIGYLAHEREGTTTLGVAYNAFLAAMGLVVLADSVLTFLIAWELMSLASFVLVMHYHRGPQGREVRRAGFIYLTMTHAGTAFLLLAFLVLFQAAGSASLDFAAFRSAAAGLAPRTRDLVFLLALVGFGTKAGLIPLHIWLPRAHPAAPSHVSALMSGVMIKTALYGLLRVGWEFAGPGPLWWGGLLLALGIVSAFLGVLYALLEPDLKRLLAYSSVENIGLMVLGLGTALLLSSLGHPVAAALALTASLVHLLNHTVFKGLLFLGAGAVQHATHTRNLEQLGGLIRTMPQTAACFLAGSAAIAAILPFNGFVGEWLTLQGLLQLGVVAPGPLGGFAAATGIGTLAIVGGLAAFTFVKAFAVAFLGVPRTAHATGTHEAPATMRLAMWLLALLCIVLGLLPTLTLRLIAPVSQQLAGAVAQPTLGLHLTPAGAAESGRLLPLGIVALIAGGSIVALALGRLLGGPGRERIAPPWFCGVDLEPRMQYTATALTKALRIIFQRLAQPDRDVSIQPKGSFFPQTVRYVGSLKPIYEQLLYRPAIKQLLSLARRLRVIQQGQLRLYLAYVFATLVVVLLIAR